jgi:Icc-related predicted phosphoesterase
VSDVHLEFYYAASAKVVRTVERIPVLAPTLMLAGDIHNPHRLFTELVFEAFCKRWEKVFFVPGNHDYWVREKKKKRGDWKWAEDVPLTAPLLFDWYVALEKKFPNLSMLRNDVVVEHGGKRFLGDTMWFPDLPLNFPFKQEMNDFDCIPEMEPWIYARHAGFRDFLRKELQPGDVVMTHYLPTYAAIPEQWRGDNCNPFYAAEMSDFIMGGEPSVWVHGHAHAQFDRVMDKTRVVRNPKGYPSRLMPEFDSGMVVEV